MLFHFCKKDFSSLSVSGWPQALLILMLCTMVGACAARKSVQPPEAKPPEAGFAPPAETAPVAYYTGVDQLTVYSEPRSSSSPVTQLPLHQKVYRYKMEKGYAYVKVEGSGVTGWVDNARLIWRLPAQQEKASTKPEEQSTKPRPEAPVVKEKSSPPTTAAEAAEPEPPPTAAETPAEQKPVSPVAAPTNAPPAQSAPAAPSTSRPIGPSIFNPF